ncbi:MAG: hypothetical protein EXS36_02160 [Pedosphaera sp.]|nr:hypothetical protein [Pedosphaera sp.]
MRFSFLPLFALALDLVFTSFPAIAGPKVSLQLVADGLTSPVAYASLPDGRALVVDQIGQVRLIGSDGKLSGNVVADIKSKLSTLNHGAFDERGMLSLVLHPGFSSNRRVVVSYTAPLRPGGPLGYDCTLRVAEWTLPSAEPLALNTTSERVLLEIDKPFSNHNGGRLAFGSGGYLYISVGDGGNGNDQGRRPPTGNGQNLDTLLGKILRIDIDAAGGVAVPKDNPFSDGKIGRPEIFAYGIRNPWGMSFDRGGDHALYVTDVGQSMFEELNIIVKGGNYGWFLREGFVGFDAQAPTKPPVNKPKTGVLGEPLIDPVAVYKNVNGFRKDSDAYGISVTGGNVYRGRDLPELVGHYVYGDWSRSFVLPQGQLLVARRPAPDASGPWTVEPIELASPEKLGAFIIAFGQDNDGEMYVMTNGNNGLTPGKGKVWKIRPAGAL